MEESEVPGGKGLVTLWSQKSLRRLEVGEEAGAPPWEANPEGFTWEPAHSRQPSSSSQCSFCPGEVACKGLHLVEFPISMSSQQGAF